MPPDLHHLGPYRDGAGLRHARRDAAITREVAMTQPTTPPAGEPPATPPAPATPEQPPADPPKDDVPAGDKRAILAELAKEREKRHALEKRQTLDRRIDALAAALGDGDPKKGKSDVELLNERFDTYERELADERRARWRAELAAEKALPPALAARLQGSTRDELAADADVLKALLPATPDPAAPRTPAPDPTQGARGPVDIDAQIRDAETKGDVRAAIRLKNQKLLATQNTQ